MNGGIEPSRAQKAQSLLQAKNDKDKSKKWLRARMLELSKELASTNEKWKRKSEELAGISQELAEIGWAAMDGDSDYEEEEEEQRQLEHQLIQEQEGHYQHFAQRQAKGKGKQREGEDADMGAVPQGEGVFPNPEDY